MYKAPFIKMWVTVDGVDVDISQTVASLKYKRDIEKENELSFKVEQGYIEKLTDGILRRGQTVKVQYGFKGGSKSPLHKVRIVELKRNYGAKVSLAVKCRDLGTVMKKSFSNKVWRNVTTSQIAEEIAAVYDLEFVGEQTEYVWDNYPQTQKDDYSFLQEVVEKDDSGNLYLYIDDGRLVLERRGLNKSSALTFQYGQGDRVLSFSVSEQEKTAGMTGAAGSTFIGFDPDKKQKLEAKAGEGNEKEGIDLGQFGYKYSANGDFLGKSNDFLGFENNGFAVSEFVSDVSEVLTNVGSGQGASQVVGGLNVGGSGNPNAENKQLGQNYLTNMKSSDELVNSANFSKKSGKLKISKGKLKIVGEPSIKLNSVVTMRGLLELDNGNYLVKCIEHDVSPSGFFTTLDMNKNASSRPSSVGDIATTDPKKINQTVGPEVIEAVQEVFVFNANGERVEAPKKEYKVD